MIERLVKVECQDCFTVRFSVLYFSNFYVFGATAPSGGQGLLIHEVF